MSNFCLIAFFIYLLPELCWHCECCHHGVLEVPRVGVMMLKMCWVFLFIYQFFQGLKVTQKYQTGVLNIAQGYLLRV